ncbi:MAG: recombinase family protein [Anaerolineae bacterium]|nr:recombinase family protein [Anaerolineae bacterium]
MSNRAVLYARVSSDDSSKDGRNLTGQLEMCRDYAQGQGWQVVAELSEDERGVSGARWDAPELNRALEMAQGGEFDTLVVREMDRFARKLAKQLVIEEQFKRAGVGVVYVLEEYADSPEGRLSKHIRATIAEYEREKIKERTVRARRRVVSQGNIMLHGGKAPYGYRLVKENGRSTLVICEDEARIVRLIFEWYTVEGLTIYAIIRRLSDMKIPSPADRGNFPHAHKKRGIGEWSRGGVANILNKETYAGTWHYGKQNSNTGERNPKEHHIAVTVPAIISRETWDIAQARKVQNKANAKRNTQYEYMVRGMLRCGQCGATVGIRASPLKSGVLLYYRCEASFGTKRYCHKCSMRDFRADRVDAVVWQWLRDLLKDPETIRAKAEAYRAQRAEATRPLRDSLAVIDHLLAERQQELKRAVDAYLKGGLLGKVLQEQAKQLEAAINSLESDRAELVQQIEADTLTDEQIYTLEHLAGLIGEGLGLADANFTERRYIVETLRFKGKLLLIDGQKYIDASCYLGEDVLNVSTVTKNYGPRGYCLAAGM